MMGMKHENGFFYDCVLCAQNEAMRERERKKCTTEHETLSSLYGRGNEICPLASSTFQQRNSQILSVSPAIVVIIVITNPHIGCLRIGNWTICDTPFDW